LTLRIQKVDNRPADVHEGGTLKLWGTLLDEEGDPIPGTDLDSCTLRLTDVDTGEVINSHEATDIQSLVGEDGMLSLVLKPPDNPIVTAGAAGTKERHVALVQYEWDTDKGDSGIFEIDVLRITGIGEE